MPNDNSPTAIERKEPFRVALVRLVTGDQQCIDLVSPHAVYEEPRALAFCLEAQLLAAQCIFCFSSPDSGPRFCMFAKPFQRLGSLCEHLEGRVQGLLANSDVARIKVALNTALAREPVWEERVRGAKIFYYSEVVERLMHRIQGAGSEIFKRIRKGEVRATAVPIDGGVEGPAGDMPSSAITEEMFIGDDGCIHQSRSSTRKWKSLWIEEVATAAESTALKRQSGSSNCDRGTPKKRKGRDSAAEQIIEAIRQAGPRRRGEFKKTYRARLMTVMKGSGDANPPRDPKTFVKHGA